MITINVNGVNASVKFWDYYDDKRTKLSIYYLQSIQLKQISI